MAKPLNLDRIDTAGENFDAAWLVNEQLGISGKSPMPFGWDK